nr:MAG TPA: hypothetical protein [Caudoviricetes sp.]
MQNNIFPLLMRVYTPFLYSINKSMRDLHGR